MIETAKRYAGYARSYVPLLIERLSLGTVHFIEREKWSIGIYSGNSPLNIRQPANVKNPVLTAKDITDVKARFVADPFMLREGSSWYMFFEIYDKKSNKGSIGLATSPDGLGWSYEKVVLEENFHLSYPHVFKWKDEFYMIPETRSTKSIRLYKAEDFPGRWAFQRTLLQGDFSDSTVFNFDRKWWLFTSDRDDRLLLFYSDKLTGPWRNHPKNPIIEGNSHIARPGGRVIQHQGTIIRYAQDDSPYYGFGVNAFKIKKLTQRDYQEEAVEQNPVLPRGKERWNSWGMHHADVHPLDGNSWIAAVDGN